MDEVKRTINGKAHSHVAKDPRIRQLELFNRKRIPETALILSILLEHLANLRGLLSNPESIIEPLKKGEKVPLFEVDTYDELQLHLSHLKNFPYRLVDDVMNAFITSDRDLEDTLAKIRIQIGAISLERIEAYTFMVEKPFVKKTKKIKLLVSPYDDTTPFDFLIHKTLNIGTDRKEAVQATTFKNEVVLPKYISRLRELVRAEFPLDSKILEERIGLLYAIPIFVDVDDYKNLNGYYNPGFGAVHISHFIPGKSEEKTESILYHELSHVLSSISDLDANEISVGLRRVFYSDDPIVEKRQTELGRALNEAFTSSLQEWLLSDKTPNFGRMTVAQFFKGPRDFGGTYIGERKFFAEIIGNMPIGNMTRAYFEDCKLLNKISETQTYKGFLGTLARYFPGGFSALAVKLEHVQSIEAQNAVMLNK